MIFTPIQVITRPKKNGVGTHFGVLFSDGTVFDYSLDEGLRQISLAEFSEGARIMVVREVPWHMANVVHARLEELRRNPRKYDFLGWNCETFAEWLTTGVPRSAQVTAGLLLTGVAMVLVIAAKR